MNLCLRASAELKVPRTGKCKVCGRVVPGLLVPNMGHLCEGECPRCGIKPFYMEHIGPYTGNVARMPVGKAIEFVRSLDDPDEVEVAFRLEIIGHPPEGRRAFLEAAYDHYWNMSQVVDPGLRAKILSLDECIDEWNRELAEPRKLQMYSALVRAV